MIEENTALNVTTERHITIHHDRQFHSDSYEVVLYGTIYSYSDGSPAQDNADIY